mgnify:CR=1 FL=1
MMKKTWSVLLSVLLLFAFSSMAVASPINGVVKNKVKQVNKVNQEIKEKYRTQKEKQVQVEDRVQDGNTIEKQVPKAARFKDMEKHWAKGTIELLAGLGLLYGYPDGTFQPDQSVTQAECIELLMRLRGDVDEEDADEELDEEIDEDKEVPAWAQNAFKKAAKKGIINVNRFHSAVQADRALVAVWVAKAMQLDPVDTSEMPYSDYLLISKEDLGYILALYKEGLMVGTPDGKFNPNSKITRAEMAAILQRILDEEGNDEEPVEDEVIAAELERTGQAGIHEDKIYEEYQLVADDEVISLNEDNIRNLTLAKDEQDPVKLTPNADDTLWFNVQKESADYVLIAEDQDGNIYEAKLEWDAPEPVEYDFAGEIEVNYFQFELGDLDLTEVDKIYQIDPDGDAAEITSNTTYLMFDTNNPDGKYIYLILNGTEWYTTTINFAD